MAPHPVDVYVGKRLRMRRTMLGMSQEALGRAIGVTFQQVQKYERGVNRIGASRLYEFSRILNVPVDFFYEGYDADSNTGGAGGHGFSDSGEQEYIHEQLAQRETMEIMRAYYAVEPKVRKRITDLVKALANSGTN
jgi:transcriptional regulator with XRE-family HTH domain